jgi:hypothetical protein
MHRLDARRLQLRGARRARQKPFWVRFPYEDPRAPMVIGIPGTDFA